MRIVTALALTLFAACSWSIAARAPKPAINVQGQGRLNLALSQKVPDTITMMDGKFTATEVHQTLRNAFNNGFSDVQSQDGEYTLELQSIEMTREVLNGLGSTIAIRYKANLRDTKSGAVLRSSAGTAFPKNPMTNEWERIYDDAYEVMFEHIANQLLPEGILPSLAATAEPAPAVAEKATEKSAEKATEKTEKQPAAPKKAKTAKK